MKNFFKIVGMILCTVCILCFGLFIGLYCYCVIPDKLADMREGLDK